MERQKEASVKPADTTRIPEMVMVFGVNRRIILRRQRRVDGVAGSQVPCSIRDITGFTTMPPAQVSP